MYSYLILCYKHSKTWIEKTCSLLLNLWFGQASASAPFGVSWDSWKAYALTSLRVDSGCWLATWLGPLARKPKYSLSVWPYLSPASWHGTQRLISKRSIPRQNLIGTVVPFEVNGAIFYSLKSVTLTGESPLLFIYLWKQCREVLTPLLLCVTNYLHFFNMETNSSLHKPSPKVW